MKKQLLAVVLSLALIGGTLPATFVQAQSAVSETEMSGTEKEGDKETLGTEGEGDKGTSGTEGEDSKDVPEASGPSAGDGSANYAANSLPLIEGQGETQGLTEEEFESLKTALAALPAAETVQELDEAKQQELYQELLAIEEKLEKLTEEQKAQINQEQLE